MPEQLTKPFSIQIDNLTAKDARFLGEVVRLFCDPLHAEMADHVREARLCLTCANDGELIISASSPLKRSIQMTLN